MGQLGHGHIGLVGISHRAAHTRTLKQKTLWPHQANDIGRDG